MAILKVSLKGESSNVGNKKYHNKINAKDFRKISLILSDLKTLGLPIDKAIKEFKLKKSDWDAALGL